ncbi:MAG TPA: GAF domain-containing protein [Anaerolineales bacterium]
MRIPDGVRALLTPKPRATERARTSLELLYSISRELAAQLDLRQLLQRVLQLMLENVGAASGSILVLDEAGKVAEGALAFGGRVHDHTAQQLADTFERGLAGWVVENRQAALVPSTRDDGRWLRRPGEQTDGESRSAISVPLMARDRVVGALTLVHPQVGYFSEDDLALITAIADQAGIAVENARLYTAEQERRRFASTLQEIARTISSALDPALVFPQVLEQLERVIHFRSASIQVIDRDELRLVAARGFEDNEAVVGLTLPIREDVFVGRVVASRQPIVVHDVQQDPAWIRSDDLPESARIRGWICAPLLVRDRAVGVLNVDSHEAGAYGPGEVEVVMAFADHAATAVLNAQLFAESQRQVHAMVALAETARVVSGSLNLDEVLHRIADQTCASLEVESALLWLIDETSGELEFRRASGLPLGEKVEPGRALEERVAGWVARTGEAVAIKDAAADPRFGRPGEPLHAAEALEIAGAPIQVQDRTIGVLQAINPDRGEFPPDQIDLLRGIAGLAGTAIAHAQLFAETQAARQLYAGLFEDSIDPILITDLSGMITDANDRAQSFLGYRRTELAGQNALNLQSLEKAMTSADLSVLEPGETMSYIARARHADGRALPVEVHTKRIDIGPQPFLQWILRDISERLELDELRADLTSMLFHDLRSPLGNIISSLEMMQASTPSQEEGGHSMMAIALRSSRRLSRLVDSLLDLGQLEAGKAVLHKTVASIRTLIAEALEEIHPVAESKGHALQFQLPPELPQVDMDVDMIRRVLINLLENAIRYTRSGGRITASASQDEGQVVVSVADSGPGIPAREQQHIFEKFTRIQQEGRSKGLGLGLAFCRLAVEAHGGRIWVESEEGQGSTFRFSLPV